MLEPTERSMPPLTMIIVMPRAPIATMTVWVKIVLKLWYVRKNSRVSAGIENNAITTIRPRNGPAWRRSFVRGGGIGI